MTTNELNDEDDGDRSCLKVKSPVTTVVDDEIGNGDDDADVDDDKDGEHDENYGDDGHNEDDE